MSWSWCKHCHITLDSLIASFHELFAMTLAEMLLVEDGEQDGGTILKDAKVVYVEAGAAEFRADELPWFVLVLNVEERERKVSDHEDGH